MPVIVREFLSQVFSVRPLPWIRVILAVNEFPYSVLDDATKHLSVHRKRVVRKFPRIKEGVRFFEKLFDRRTVGWVADQTAPHGLDDGVGDSSAAWSMQREVNVVVNIDNSLATRHLVCDMAEGRRAVHHLVKNATQGPNIARSAEFHQLG